MNLIAELSCLLKFLLTYRNAELFLQLFYLFFAADSAAEVLRYLADVLALSVDTFDGIAELIAEYFIALRAARLAGFGKVSVRRAAYRAGSAAAETRGRTKSEERSEKIHLAEALPERAELCIRFSFSAPLRNPRRGSFR